VKKETKNSSVSRPSVVPATAIDAGTHTQTPAPAPSSSASAFPKAEVAPAPREEKPGRGRPATAPRCQKCGNAQYACKCAKPEIAVVQSFDLNDATVRMMLNFPWNLAGKLIAYKAGYPPDEFCEVWQFTDAELKELIPPAKAVTEKYAPAFLAKYEMEINLVGAISQVVISKMLLIAMQVKKLQKNETGQAAHAAPPQPPKEKPAPSPAAPVAPAKNPPPAPVESEFGSAAAFATEFAGSHSL
jgi:hypothetical protein